ncbi:phosphatidylinositol 5-phosphate 4-kinase type-2 gamma-like isoform X1 [Betta splendens]|uniref:Phosphatidylinositol 5-phosphate 4-kinase type-2 gamma n=1 Tax=Betta splendens TaxID=158456 RepID=A0A6P7MIT6_BETSP|nr:phosphatidylinositol 5-phosphate 4-kinase type-2 gamma-like isoform X1 [Betta splendens]
MSSPGASSNPLAPKRKTKKKHFVQQKVEVFRGSDPVLSVLMWGVNHSINDLSQVPVPVMLLPDDFKASTKIKVCNHLFNKENLPGQFKFKEYCPQVFRNLRERFGIDDADYQVNPRRVHVQTRFLQPTGLLAKEQTNPGFSFSRFACFCVRFALSSRLSGRLLGRLIASLTACADKRPAADSEHMTSQVELTRPSVRQQVSLARSPPLKDGEGQSVGLLLTSYDHTLVVKEISSEEVEEMHNILCEYHQHIATCHGSTLLPHFLAMYRVTVESEDTYLLAMRNMFSRRLHVHRKYDLKGSLVSREASFKEKVKELPTYKDTDFRNKMQKVYVSGEEKSKVMEKLNRDIDFLVRMRIMDYSLLLGIHDAERAEREAEDEMEPFTEEEEEEEENGAAGSLRAPGPGEVDPHVDVYAVQSAVGAPQREVYFMGLIDVLTQYDTKKKAAHAARAVKHGGGGEISAVPPEQYAKRFLEFVAKIFASDAAAV